MPKFDKQIARPTQVIQHDYPFDKVDTDPTSHKQRWVIKRTPQPIPLDKIRGREDNLMYKVSEGYNLKDASEQTFFDKHNIMELLSIGGRTEPQSTTTNSGRTVHGSSSIEAIKRYKSTSSTLSAMLQRHAQRH